MEPATLVARLDGAAGGAVGTSAVGLTAHAEHPAALHARSWYWYSLPAATPTLSRCSTVLAGMVACSAQPLQAARPTRERR